MTVCKSFKKFRNQILFCELKDVKVIKGINMIHKVIWLLIKLASSFMFELSKRKRFLQINTGFIYNIYQMIGDVGSADKHTLSCTANKPISL